jgi:cytidylate kinase
MIVIMRGISGSGKSTVAHALSAKIGAKIVSADNYFMGHDGVYRFDARQLGMAHDMCWSLFSEAVSANANVIVDNTNAKLTDIMPYVFEGLRTSTPVHIVQMAIESSHMHYARNVHGLSIDAIERQAQRLSSQPITKDYLSDVAHEYAHLIHVHYVNIDISDSMQLSRLIENLRVDIFNS